MTIEFDSFLIGFGFGLLAVVFVRVVDAIVEKMK
jgi:hypothetical protein